MNGSDAGSACEEYEFDVADWVDGTLSPEKARIVSLHVAGCARCRRWREQYAALDARLAAALPPPRLSADFEWRLQTQVRATGRAIARPDRLAAEKQYAVELQRLRRELRSNTGAALVTVAFATAGAVALLPAVAARLDAVGITLAGQSPGMLAYLGTAAAAVIAALAWSAGRGVLPRLPPGG